MPTNSPEIPADTEPPPKIEPDSVEYDPAADAYRAAFDAEDGPDAVVVAVVETIGAVTDRELTEISPLHWAIDPAALGDLLSAPRKRPVDVTFTHDAVRVRVSSRGTVVARPVES